jgi:hypothetical protein
MRFRRKRLCNLSKWQFGTAGNLEHRLPSKKKKKKKKKKDEEIVGEKNFNFCDVFSGT